MSSRYGMQLLEDVAFRQEWAKKLSLGFDLSTNEPSLIGYVGYKQPRVLNKRKLRKCSSERAL
jgi:hypothetical protein